MPSQQLLRAAPICGMMAGIALSVLGTGPRAQEPMAAYVTLGDSPLRRQVDSFEILLPPLDRERNSPVITALAASHDGRFLAAAGDDHVIRIVDVTKGHVIETISGHTDWIQALTFSSDDHVLYSAGNDGKVLRWNHRYPVSGNELIHVPFAVRSLSIATEKRLLAIGGFHDKILVLDTSTGKIRHRLRCDCRDQRCVRFSPDGNHLLCGGREGEVRVWHAESGDLLAQFHEHRGRVYTAAFSTDGMHVSSVGEDRQLIQYDLHQRSVTARREIAAAKLMSMCLINDQVVAVAGADNSIHLYDAMTNEVVAHLNGHFGTVAVMAPCGDYLASGSFDTTIRIWDLASVERNAMESSRPVRHAPLKMDDRLQIR